MGKENQLLGKNQGNYHSFNDDPLVQLENVIGGSDVDDDSPPNLVTREELAQLQSDIFKDSTAISFFSTFKQISRLALPMGLSFTFSFEVSLSILFLQLLSQSDDQSDGQSEYDSAAATLDSTYMNTIVILLASVLFSEAIILSGMLGQWNKEDNSDEFDGIPMDKTEEKNRLKASIESINVNGLFIAAGVTIPAFIALYCSQPILTLFHQDEHVVESAAAFLETYAFAIPGVMVRAAIEQVMFGFAQSRPAMWIGLVNLSIGTALSAILGFGLLGAPKLAQRGVALGFVIESYLTMLCYGLFVKFGQAFRGFNFFTFSSEKIREHVDILIQMLKLGGTISFTMVIELALPLSVSILSGLEGTESQSAMAYCLQFIYFESIMVVAFAMSCSQELSRALGAKELTNAQHTAKYGLLTGLIYLIPLPVFFALYPKALEIISGGASEEVSHILRILVPIMSAGIIFEFPRFTMLQELRALGDLFVPNVITTIGMLMGIGSAALLGKVLGIYGVGAGYTLGTMTTACMLMPRWWNKIESLTDEKNHDVKIEDEESHLLERVEQPSISDNIANSARYLRECALASFPCLNHREYTAEYDRASASDIQLIS
ncbi:MAG: mdtK [Gammaproteobacteria bacterium]|jgi:Na+-driven multidrug efflux pump|nr:mdtK [Gammaproteobacteria bacterium]